MCEHEAFHLLYWIMPTSALFSPAFIYRQVSFHGRMTRTKHKLTAIAMELDVRCLQIRCGVRPAIVPKVSVYWWSEHAGIKKGVKSIIPLIYVESAEDFSV
jgi:hypothetical protein